MDELKPCPFCGEQNINLEIQGGDYFCYCGDCGTENTAGYDKASAVRFWNTRPLEDAQAAEIERLKAVLEFYAEPDNWKEQFVELDASWNVPKAWEDDGDKARDALKGGGE